MRKVLVIGDSCQDIFNYGVCNRLCPEAPVPVVHVTGVEMRPGGAANVAQNIATLGAQVTLCGLVGFDSNAKELKQSLESFKKLYLQGELCDCGNPIWIAGSSLAGKGCFCCITGETDCSEDYEVI